MIKMHWQPANQYPMKTKLILTLAAALSAACFFSSCVAYRTPSRHSEPNSIVQFLYPQGVPRIQEPAVPLLSLPLKVGIAFAPPLSETSKRNIYSVPEQQKLEVMNNVASHFRELPFVSSIELIPSLYLRPGGGFENMDQLGRFFDLDVIVLLAADQVQFFEDNAASLLYLTVVGAFLVEGERNTTHTMLEAAVFHLPTRQLLFRAPGVSEREGRATAMNSERRARESSQTGYMRASADLAVNLQHELAAFEKRVKEEPERYKVERRPRYAGGGSLSAGGIVILLLSLGAGLRASRRYRP